MSDTAGRAYRALLRVLPPAFHARYAAEMCRMFLDEWQEAGAAGRVRLAGRAIRDVFVSAIILRMSPERYLVRAPDMVNAGGWFHGTSGDLRVALRGLAQRPGFALTAVVTLALGIGATTAVFSVVDATVLRALRIPERDRAVAFWTQFERSGNTEFLVSQAEYTDLRDDVRSLERVGAWGSGDALLLRTDGRAARTINLAFTVGDIYDLTGARAVLGRLPGEADDRLDAGPVAVLSHALWVGEYGGDSSVIGSVTLPIGADPPLIIGVLAPDVALPGTAVSDPSAGGGSAEAWVHTVLNPATWVANRSGHGLQVIARLRPDASLAGARAELRRLHVHWRERYAGQHSFGLDGHTVLAESLDKRALGGARRIALVLAAASGLLLALACANVANLLLARGETRRSEIGVRVALGATPLRVARPVLLEGVWLGVLGGILGLGIVTMGMRLLLQVAPAGLTAGASPVMDVRTLAFTMVISLVTGILFTLAPAWNAARQLPADLLRGAGRGRTGPTRGLRLLVAGQTALATLLLIGAALLARTLQELNTVDPGLEPANRVAIDLSLPAARYADAGTITAFYDQVMSQIDALPGVELVAAVRNLPLRSAQRREGVRPEGSGNPADVLSLSVQAGSPNVLRTLGISLLEGRDLEASDRIGSPPVVLLNRVAAAALWPGESAVGKRLVGQFLPASYGPVTVVGTYADVRVTDLASVAAPEIILPMAQSYAWSRWARNMTLVMHTSGVSTPALVASVRGVLRTVDPSVAVEMPTTLEAVVRASTARERFLAALLVVFSGVALAIAAIGVFGVVSFTVARQAREFAIRGALGATRGDVLRGVLLGSVMVAGAGAVAGAVMGATVAPALRDFLYQVSPRDLVVLIGVPLTMVIVATGSSFLPALRATRVAPGRVLQECD